MLHTTTRLAPQRNHTLSFVLCVVCVCPLCVCLLRGGACGGLVCVVCVCVRCVCPLCVCLLRGCACSGLACVVCVCVSIVCVSTVCVSTAGVCVWWSSIALCVCASSLPALLSTSGSPQSSSGPAVLRGRGRPSGQRWVRRGTRGAPLNTYQRRPNTEIFTAVRDELHTYTHLVHY